MANTTLTNSNTAPSVPVTSPEELREQLLRPFPQVTARGVLLALVIVLILIWSFSGAGPSPANRVTSIFDPFIAMGNLIGRMLPPEFEVARTHSVIISAFNQPLVDTTITSSTVTIFGTEVLIGWLPIITAIFETIQMAIVGTLGAIMMALPLALLAARNVSPHPAVYQATRMLLNFLRSIPELVYAILFVAAVGLGPFTGVLALAFGSVGSLARVFSEAIEQIDPAQVNAVRATGATGMQTFIFSALPQAVPLFISYSIIYFESNVRHATILGLVGAGGVGFLLYKYTGTSDYDKVLGTAIVLVIAVTVIDRFSSWLRQRII